MSNEAVSSTLVTHEPGGCECESCGEIFIGGELDQYCPSCTEGRAQDDWERRNEEGPRGDEYANELAESQARIQRELK